MKNKIKNTDKTLYNIVIAIMALVVAAGVIIMCAVSDDTSLFYLIGSVILAIFVYVNFIMAGYFYFIAVDKGYTDRVYLRINFFLPVIGQLLVIAMPNLKMSTVNTKKDFGNELPEI